MTDIELLTALIVGEAGSEPLEGQIAVGWTVRNRVRNPRWWGSGWRGVMLKPSQYTALALWTPESLLAKATAQHRRVAEDVYHGRVADPTGGATHYHAHCGSPIWGRPEYASSTCPPRWTRNMTYLAQIGNHLFYREGSITPSAVLAAGVSGLAVALVVGLVWWAAT